MHLGVVWSWTKWGTEDLRQPDDKARTDSVPSCVHRSEARGKGAGEGGSGMLMARRSHDDGEFKLASSFKEPAGVYEQFSQGLRQPAGPASALRI